MRRLRTAISDQGRFVGFTSSRTCGERSESERQRRLRVRGKARGSTNGRSAEFDDWLGSVPLPSPQTLSPRRAGRGSRACDQLGGEATVDFLPRGVVYTI